MSKKVDNCNKGSALTDDREAKINEIIVEGNKVIRMEVDHSSTCDEKIPLAEKLAAEGKLDEALLILTSLEKQTRTGCDMHSTSRVLVAIVNACFGASKWELLNEHIVTLTKKRSQLKASVAKMVQQCCKWIADGSLPSKGGEIELQLIRTLRTVTEGKIYVEVERARITHRLAQIKEQEGDIEEAAKIMRELQVETYGSMDRKEKVEMILEQMRLCLAIKDYIRTQIISKKISVKFFDNEEYQHLRLKYYEYMIELDQHEGTYLNICRHFRAIHETPCIKANDEMRLKTMKHVALYIILSPYDNEQSDLIHRILETKDMEELPMYKAILKLFTNTELIDQALFYSLYEARLRTVQSGSDDLPTDVFNPKLEAGVKRWEHLKSRIVEHNIRIMAKYYTRITLSRMSELLALSETEAEQFLCDMVVNKSVEAKTDRLNGIIQFGKYQSPNERLNDWSGNISELMSHVMKTTHLINKEEMIHKHLLRKEEESSIA